MPSPSYRIYDTLKLKLIENGSQSAIKKNSVQIRLSIETWSKTWIRITWELYWNSKDQQGYFCKKFNLNIIFKHFEFSKNY